MVNKIKFAISIFTSKLVSCVFHLLYLIGFAINVRKMRICPLYSQWVVNAIDFTFSGTRRKTWEKRTTKG